MVKETPFLEKAAQGDTFVEKAAHGDIFVEIAAQRRLEEASSFPYEDFIRKDL